jgi:AcrR family transcriptional regulator
MSKAKQTRERILKEAAELFNQQGYAGSSMSDIMRVTGLQKGGIYNHFESKEQLALAAFDFAIASIQSQYRLALRGKRHSLDRLRSLINIFGRSIDNPLLRGGCPILNTAIESDDSHPALRDRAQKAMDSWRELICRIINAGIKKGEIREDIQAEEFVTIAISLLEGGLMMSKLYGDAIHLQRAIAHLNDYIKSQFIRDEV